MIHTNVEQGTEAWRLLRCGKVTASRIADLTAKTAKGQPGAGRKNYRAQLVCERLTGEPAESFESAEMRRGKEIEPDARVRYEVERFTEVTTVAFADHPRIAMAGASPDGLVGDVGLVEFKCPNTATHIEYITSQVVPGHYVKQMQWQMACCEREWCDFISYDPRLPDHMAMWVKRVERDKAMIAELEGEVATFLKELEAEIAALVERFPAPDAE